MNRSTEQPHILFLFSDTGGGHRSAVEAIIEALNMDFPERVSYEMVDIFRQYMPAPLDLAPDIYPPLTSHMADVWEFGYRVSDGRRRSRLFNSMLWPYIRRAAHRLVTDHPCDLIVSVHGFANAPVLRALPPQHVPFVTVVTDLISTHALWFHPNADMVIVPTDEARLRGIEMGLRPEQINVIGLPVAQRFCRKMPEKKELRNNLGWPDNLPIVLLIGGGDGLGPLERTALALNNARLPIGLVIVTGRNRNLKKRLEETSWHNPALIYGFVREMPEFMNAADILVTKAGPGTISEGFIAGLPIILYSHLPGQEDGNINYVVDSGAGIWAPEPKLVALAVRQWLENPAERLKAADISRQRARPLAARQIADLLATRLGITTDGYSA